MIFSTSSVCLPKEVSLDAQISAQLKTDGNCNYLCRNICDPGPPGRIYNLGARMMF